MGSRAKLSAAVLGLVLAGAPASVILDQFLNEKEGNSLTAYKDGSGIWTICRGATTVDGKPVTPGMRLGGDQVFNAHRAIVIDRKCRNAAVQQIVTLGQLKAILQFWRKHPLNSERL